MSRKQTEQPLEFAAPGLQTTARQLAIQPGAAAPAQRSPLMELGEALKDFNPVLSASLKDAAAKEEFDALHAGELEAQRTEAVKKIGEIDAIVTAAVDSGKVSKTRLPAFHRGFRMRVGKDLAQSKFNEALQARFHEATRVEGRVDPEAIIGETYKSVIDQLSPQDSFARIGFDQTAQGIAANYRNNAALAYQKNYTEAAEQAAVNEGSDYLINLTNADPSDDPAYMEGFRTYINELRAGRVAAKDGTIRDSRIATQETDEFVVRRVLAPTVQELIVKGKSDEALDLLQKVESLDITGKGGLFGAKTDLKPYFNQLRDQIEKRIHVDQTRREDDDRKSREAQRNVGFDDAGKLYLELRTKGGGVVSREAANEALKAYSEQHKDSPTKVDSFRDQMLSMVQQDEALQTNDWAVAELTASIASAPLSELGAARDRLNALKQLRQVKPDEYVRLSADIDRRSKLSSIFDVNSGEQGRRRVFPVDAFGGQSLNLGTDPADEQAAQVFNALPSVQKEKLNALYLQTYRQSYLSQVEAINDVEQVTMRRADLALKSQEEAKVAVRSALLKALPKEAGAEKPGQKPQEPAGSPQKPKPDNPALQTPTPGPQDEGNAGRRDAARDLFKNLFTRDPWGPAFDYPTDALKGLFEKDATLKPRLLQHAVSTTYNRLLEFPVDGSRGTAQYLSRLRDFAERLQQHGGAEYLTQEQLTAIGLKPAAFPNVGSKVGTP